MTGPVGFPGDGPDKKWKIPFYAARLVVMYAAAMVADQTPDVAFLSGCHEYM